jgi:ABC-type nitrate/sulfonate/bicarbonate transport system substrate-binding protein
MRVGGVPEHFNLPWQLAMEAGEIDIEWVPQPGGTGQMVAGLRDGELDAIVALTEGVVAAIDGGLPATVVQVYVGSPLQWGVHVAAGSEVTDEAQLAGRRIAISRFGSGSHLMAYVQAERMGWTLTPEQFVVVSNLEGARAALAAGEADEFLWDRFMTQHLVDAGEFRRVGVQPTPWPCFVVAHHNDLAAESQAALHHTLDAVMAEAAAFHGRPDVVELLCTRIGLDEPTAREWLAVTRFAARQPPSAAMLAEVRSTLARVGVAP